MKKIEFILHKRFKKRLLTLHKKNQIKVWDILRILENYPHDKSLRRHKLKGKYIGKETIDVTGDLRILMEPKTGEIIDILDIGNHSYFYKK